MPCLCDSLGDFCCSSFVDLPSHATPGDGYRRGEAPADAEAFHPPCPVTRVRRNTRRSCKPFLRESRFRMFRYPSHGLQSGGTVVGEYSWYLNV